MEELFSDCCVTLKFKWNNLHHTRLQDPEESCQFFFVCVWLGFLCLFLVGFFLFVLIEAEVSNVLIFKF